MERQETLSVADAGAALGVSQRTVRRWCLEGKLQAEKPGRAHLIDPASVEELWRQIASEDSEIDANTAGPNKEDRPVNGQEVNLVAEDGENNGQTEDRRQEKIGRLCEQLEREEQANRKLTATADNLKNALGLMAVVFFLGTAAMAFVLYEHHDNYVHVQGRQWAIQKRQERTEKELLERRLTALEQIPVVRDELARSAGARVMDSRVSAPRPARQLSKRAKALTWWDRVTRKLHSPK